MIIYKITNSINNKCYIGITTRTFKERYPGKTWWSGRGMNKLLKKSIIKNGIDFFKIEVLEHASSKDELIFLEKYYIRQYDSMIPNGYNLTTGGDGVDGYCMSDIQRKKIGIASKNRISYWKGKKRIFSKDRIENARRGRMKAVLCFDKSGNFIKEYESVQDTKIDGFTTSTVVNCCKGKRQIKSHKGFIFKYKETK